MNAAIVVVGAVLLVIGYFSLLIVLSIFKQLATAFADLQQSIKNSRAQKTARRDDERAEAYRAQHPVRVVGIPNPDPFRRVFSVLDEYTRAATAYRPLLPSGVDTRFRSCHFQSQMFDLARPHPGALSSTEPRMVSLTSAAVLMMGGGFDISGLYTRADADCEFPFEPPQLRYSPSDAPALKPNFPMITSPSEHITRLVKSDGGEVDASDELQAKAYEPEL